MSFHTEIYATRRCQDLAKMPEYATVLSTNQRPLIMIDIQIVQMMRMGLRSKLPPK